MIYEEICKPTREVRRIPEDLGSVYLNYGSVLFSLERYDDCAAALEKALVINPVNTDAMFELSEVSKIRGDWNSYRELTDRALACAYTSKALGRCYRNLAFWCTEQGDPQSAIALYYLSLHFDGISTMPQTELFYLQNRFKVDTKPPTPQRISKVLKKYGIPFGASKTVLGLAHALGSLMKEHGNTEGARYFYTVLYDLTKDEKVNGIQESLPVEDAE